MQTLVGFISLVMGLLTIILAFKAYQDGNESKKWPRVEGEIIKGILLERWYRSGKGGSRRKQWLAHIIYKYSIDGIKYVSTQIKRTPQSWGSKKYAQRLISKYNERRIVSVYHHPTIREAKKITDLTQPFSKFVTKFVKLPDGLEIYHAASSSSPLIIKDEFTQDAKVGNALLEPGADMTQFTIVIFMGIIFAGLGFGFLTIL